MLKTCPNMALAVEQDVKPKLVNDIIIDKMNEYL